MANAIEMTKVTGMDFFNETIEEVKALSIVNEITDPVVGNDLHLTVETDLLNPAFYIHEIYGGETLVDPVAFDHGEQSFYIRNTIEYLTQDEVIQHVKRGLIGWVTGNDFNLSEERQESKRRITHMANRLPLEYGEFKRLVTEIMSFPEAVRLFMLDYTIELYEAGSSEEMNDIQSSHTKLLEAMELNRQKKVDWLTELMEKSEKDVGIMARIMRLFQ